MATINVNPTQDGFITGIGSTNFNTSRGSAFTRVPNPGNTYTNAIVAKFQKTPGRGGYAYYFCRAAFGFNVTAYSSDTITNVSLRLTTTTTTTNNLVIYAIPFTGFGSTLGSALTTGDWSNFTFNSTNYGNKTVSNSSGIQSINLSGTALTTMFTGGYVKMGIVVQIDYNGTDVAAPEVNDFLALNFNGTNNMQLRFDQAAAGYTQNVIGIAGSSMNKVIDVPKSSISDVIGIS